MIKFDTSEVKELASHLIAAELIFDRKRLNRVMTYGLEPTRTKMAQLAPVSGRGIRRTRYYNAGHKRHSMGRYNTNKLYQSIRIKVVPDKGAAAKVIVGASKKRHQAGWRAHFMDRGWTHWKTKRKYAGTRFAERAAETTANIVTMRMEEKAWNEYQAAFKKIRGIGRGKIRTYSPGAY